MTWYGTGTVAVTANSATVTGTGTAFSANARVGDAFRGPDGRWYEITNIASATVLSIRPNYQGTTASGQAYTIAPMQGYVKESADRLRQLVDQFGAQLAALQPWATAPTPAQAREALGANDAASLTAGLLNVARIPATLTPDKAYRRGNILGTVSQSGGTPTGAIIERGSNANGEYVRFADGTQICTHAITTNVSIATPFMGAFRSSGIAWTFPAAFAAPPRPAGNPGSVTSSFSVVIDSPVTTTCNFVFSAIAEQAVANRTASLIAVGRWY
ncbi:hypothetical protein [Stutzerimonas nitrititolerans]|uniref:hypothetical protein n=1 Tax=Stutzerimonas nitrititolerans TaxID=2482751 RepID=UPI00289AD385|nr:hypothetical protein [Stutzerimonas nitrititolerans]